MSSFCTFSAQDTVAPSHQKMHMCQPHVQQLLLLTLLVVFPGGLCQQQQQQQQQQQVESRRAVSEHQLMHDRGRNIQSLKRLIWLSGAMEGLHTAQSRSLDAAQEPRPAALVRDLLNDFFRGSYVERLDQPDS
ncbi:parathyroid hormone 4 [Stigmatopora nigra]